MPVQRVGAIYNKEKNMAKITGKTKAWITDCSSVSPADLSDPACVGRLTYTVHDMKSAGWTFVGEAEITIDVVDKNTLIDNKVAALKEELKTVRAEAHMKSMRLEEKIQNLLALSFDPEVTA